MTGGKRHLLLRPRRAACGVHNPTLTTNDPARVTCGGCKRTVAMAHSEIDAKRRAAVRIVK